MDKSEIKAMFAEAPGFARGDVACKAILAMLDYEVVADPRIAKLEAEVAELKKQLLDALKLMSKGK